MILPRYRPMLASAWPHPFSEPGWWFEPKWDGIRGLLSWDGDRLTVHTRTGAEVSARYPEIALPPAAPPCVVDGEIVVLEGSTASFARLQQRSALTPAGLREHPVSFLAFDLLHLGDRSLVGDPLEHRLASLDALALGAPMVRVPPITDGDALWRRVVEGDLEGMVAKRSGSRYQPGTRSPDWRKVAHLHVVKAVVGGFTPGEGGRRHTFGALVLGVWDGDRLRWVGNLGTGFSDRDLVVIREALGEMSRSDHRFHLDPELPTMTPVEPVLVAAVGFRNWTPAGRLRHPRFKGFTDDPAGTITVESERRH